MTIIEFIEKYVMDTTVLYIKKEYKLNPIFIGSKMKVERTKGLDDLWNCEIKNVLASDDYLVIVY